MALSPDGNTLYLTVGGNTNMGAPSFNFAYQWEYAWSAAIVAIDLPALTALPNLTDASSGYLYKYDLPTLDDPTRPNSAPGVDVGDPWGGNSENNGANMAIIEPGMPVTLHSVGWRNAYDVLIREDGRMFSIDNGPNVGWGGPPNNEGPDGNCDNTIDNGGDAINDNLHYVRELVPGEMYYAGHPNPLRGNPVDIFNSTQGGPAPFSEPPVPFAMANPVECDYRNPQLGEDGSLENWPYSTNGIAEYTATNFGGVLQGAILAAGWDSTNIVRVSLSFDGNDNPTVTTSDVLFQTGGAALDVTTRGDNDPFPGTVWVANLFGLGPAGVLRIYEPGDFLACNGGPTDDDDGDGYLNQDELDNGSDPCNAASVPPDFDQDFVSDLNDTNDDNDHLLDTADNFAIDVYNGKRTDLPVIYNFDTAEGGFIGSPFTGLMNNGSSEYLDLFDPANMTVIGAAGVFTIDAIPAGDARGTQNDQAYGFQFGADTCNRCNPFVAYSAMSTPLSGVSSITTENMGFFIGTGDQANYLKVVVSGGTGAGGVDVLLETNDVIQSEIGYDVPAILAGSVIELFLTVDPISLTAQPAYAIDGGSRVDLGTPLSIPATWLDVPDALAIGIIGTAGTNGTPFTGTWTEIGILPADNGGSGSWNTLANFIPNIRHENSYVELNGKFYLIGGRGTLPINIFDPVTGLWSAGAAPPLEMHHMQAVTHDGLIYVLGAMTGPYPNETPLTHVYIYDPHNDHWIQGMEIPAGRRRGSAAVAVYEDKIYIAGGIINGHVSGTVGWLDEFDPRTNTWTALPNDMPNPRDHTSGVIYDDKFYVVNGRITTTPNFAEDTIPQVDVYDFETGLWSTQANDLPTPRAAASVGLVGNELLVIGGESDVISDAHAETEALNLETGVWRALTPMSPGEDRHGSQAVFYGDQIYIAGGSGAQGGNPELDSHVQFSFNSCPVPVTVSTDNATTSPAGIDFGTVSIGGSATLAVTVSNPAGNSGPITITNADIIGLDADAFSTDFRTAVTIQPGESTPVNVTFEPSAAGDFGTATVPGDSAAAISIQHTGANSALTVPIEGTGGASSGDDPITGLSLSSNSPVILGGNSSFVSTVATGTNISYSWDFGDGTVRAGGSSETHTYAATGSYLVTVTASNSQGSVSASTTMVVQASGGFAARINAGGAAFTDSNGDSWSADTGSTGGSTYTAGIAIANTTDDLLYQSERYGDFGYDVAVPQSGCYRVNLHFAEIWWGVLGGGGDGSRIFDVTIEGTELLTNFDIHAAVGPAAATTQGFDVQVTDGNVDIDFTTDVDNAKVSALAVIFLAPSCGGGGDDPITGLSLASNSPVALGASSQFTASITGGTNVAYSWDFGDGTVRAGTAIDSHIYAAAGSYTVTVIASNSVSSDTATTTMVVNVPPDDPITGLSLSSNSPIVLGNLATFTASITGGTNVTYSWDFGDGTVRAGAATDSHTYAASGSYTVAVTASNNAGSATATTTMVVNVPPDEPITGLTVSSNSPVELGNIATFATSVTGGTNINYNWDFGDGTVRAGAAAETHTYASAGSYTVSVTASNNISSDTATTTFVVAEPPPPDDPITGLSVTGSSPVALGNAATFNSSVATGTNISYSWDFGDGTVRAGAASETHTYGAAGSYVVTVDRQQQCWQPIGDHLRPGGGSHCRAFAEQQLTCLPGWQQPIHRCCDRRQQCELQLGLWRWHRRGRWANDQSHLWLNRQFPGNRYSQQRPWQ